MIRQFSKAAAVRFFVTITDMSGAAFRSGAGAVDDSGLAEGNYTNTMDVKRGNSFFWKKGFLLILILFCEWKLTRFACLLPSCDQPEADHATGESILLPFTGFA
ncbi:hypothetical protein D5957_18910 [Salmonella enterica subsp. enterica serovar Concord]|nr:hypothetical protein [Salmonella enterica subsp. enterica serovar Concord]MMF31229.1 hypothetical protein [Salmonella enterica subsp. enterica serovar Bonn]